MTRPWSPASSWAQWSGSSWGGLIVGAFCRRAGLSRRLPLVAVCTAPGLLISLPPLGALALDREWQALPYVAVLAISSMLPAVAGSSLARLRWRNR